MTVLSNLSTTSPFPLSSKPSTESRFDSSAQNTAKTGSSTGDPVYATFQPGMGSNADSASTASAIDALREINQTLMGTRARQAQESDIPLTAGTTVQAADSPSYLDMLGVNIGGDTPPSASPTANPLSAMAATAIKGESPQLKAIDSKFRLEAAEAVTISSYLRSDNGIGERAAEQGASEIASNTAMVQPRLTESTAAQPIRDFLTAETAAAATYEEIISQQRQGITAQANQNQLRVLQLLK